MTHVVLIGRYPPPVGGNTVHIERLAHRLSNDGYLVSVIDLYGNSNSLSPTEGVSVIRGRGSVSGSLRLLVELFKRSRGAVAHFHISAGSRFYVVAPILIVLTRRASKRVLTIHSGSWVNEFQALSGIRKRLATAILQRFRDIICVNSSQETEICRSIDSRARVIPAYLSSNSMGQVPDDVRALRDSVDVMLVTSGYGTSTYGYETVLQGLELASQKLSLRLGLVISSYSNWDIEYWDDIMKAARNNGYPIVFTTDLSPDAFLGVLSLATIYIRATTTDGDAVAIREAGNLGLQVLASDVIDRPAGTVVFPCGSAKELSLAIIKAVRDGEYGRLISDRELDNYSSIVQVYRCPDAK